MGTKMAGKWILASPGKWGKMARKMGKMAGNSAFKPFSVSGHVSPVFQVRPKIHFLAIFVPISGRRPEMDLYEVHGISPITKTHD